MNNAKEKLITDQLIMNKRRNNLIDCVLHVY